MNTQLWNYGREYSTKIKNLKKATKEPYFARIDFKAEEQEEKEKIYIGRTNIFDENLNVVVADWRAPISSIYYDGQIGKVEYKVAEEIVKGELTLKRQYTIENGKLLGYNDIEVTTNDNLLQEALKEISDKRLKNIVATIQSEQNKIIRANMFKPLIVQGVAGSGKTTVALHRIAYLIYTYEKEFKPEEFLIIAPNKFFLNYISNVLPDLGVDYVWQQTFEEFASSIIKDKIKVENSGVTLKKIIEENQENSILEEASKFKSSIKFKQSIDQYLQEINEKILETKDFTIANVVAIKYNELQKIFLDNKEKISLKDRIEKLKKFMQNKLSNNHEKIIEQIRKNRQEKIDKIDQTLNEQEKEKIKQEIFEETEYEMNHLLKGGKQLVNDYIKKIKKYTPKESYKEIINNEELLEKYTTKEIAKYIKETFNLKIKKKQVEYEDLAPLMYLQYHLLGLNEKISLKHIIIDEAQDFGEFQFSCLNEILKQNKSITILGDIAQGIYSYRGTKNWEEVNKLIFNNEADIQNLNKSYRTTIEIMNEANKTISSIKDQIKINLAEPVARHGEPVSYTKTNDFNDKINKICDKIDLIKQKGYQNIAIIAREYKACEEIYNELKTKINDTYLISEDIEKYENNGITIIPSYYSKGLEFDSVIIADFEKYNNTVLDKQLLYVSLTRAMHKLDIFY